MISNIKKSYKIEVLLFSKYTSNDPRQRELVKWLGTTLQPFIRHKLGLVQTFTLKTLWETPSFYLS